MKRYLFLLLGFLILSTSSCTAIVDNKSLANALGAPTIMEPKDRMSSAIAITIDQNFRRKWNQEYKLEIKKVYFIKLIDKKDSLFQESILPSNYYFAPFMAGFHADAFDNFLLNVEPGVYAAVGASSNGYYLFFPKEVITNSIVEVGFNEMVYMGEFKLEKISYNKEYVPDECQMYYFSSRLFPGQSNYENRRVISHHPTSGFFAPKVQTIKRPTEYEENFLKDYLKRFKNTKWKGAIENRLKRINHDD